MPEAEAAHYRFNPFDITKVWSHKDYPLIDVGTIELNRNAENYFADVEQAAFTPANVVPGIGFSPDRLLQGRLFSYGDTQRYRLGINHHQIPVNAPRVPSPHSFHRDGAMRTDGNLGGNVNYEPNRFGDFAQDPNASEPPLAAGAVDRYDHRADDDYYTPAGHAVRAVRRGATRASVRQHRAAYRRRAAGHRRAADRAFPPRRSGLCEGVIAALAELAEGRKK